MNKRQFKGTSKSPPFYDRKVLRYGYSATISMGRIIPKDWQYVRVSVQSKNHNHIVLILSRLDVKAANAHNKKTNKKHKQNTQRTRPTNSN